MKIQINKPFNSDLSEMEIQILYLTNILNIDLWNLQSYLGLGVHTLNDRTDTQVNNLFLLLKNLEFDSRMSALDFIINSRVPITEDEDTSIINYIISMETLLTGIPENILLSIKEFNEEKI